MFDIAWTEFLVVAVVALVVVGPRDLPGLLRTVGKTISSLKRMAGEFQGQFNEAMREAELDDLKREVTGLKDSASKMVGASPFQIARDELKNALSDKPKKTPSALAGEAPSRDQPDDTPSALAPPAPTQEPPRPKAAEFAPLPDDKPAAKRRPPAAKAAVEKPSVDKASTSKAAPKKTAAKPSNGTGKAAAKPAAQQAAEPAGDAADAPSPPGAAA